MIARDILAQGPDWMRRNICEFTPHAKHVEFLERVLVDHKPTEQVAGDLNITRRTADDLVRRFLTYLLFT